MGRRTRVLIVMTDGEKFAFEGPDADKVYNALVSAMETNGCAVLHLADRAVRFNGVDIRSVT
jgi:hypothetical protein